MRLRPSKKEKQRSTGCLTTPTIPDSECKVHTNIENFLLLYNGVVNNKRSHGEVGRLLQKKYQNNIDIKYIDGIITIKLKNTILIIILVYAPDNKKVRKKIIHKNLQDLLDTTTNATKTIILGDLNARIVIALEGTKVQ